MPVCRIQVCRILELKKNDKTINVGMMQSIKRASECPHFLQCPAAPWGRFYSHLAKRGQTGGLRGIRSNEIDLRESAKLRSKEIDVNNLV